MRTVLICHDQHRLDRDGLARWLASFSELARVVVLQEHASTKRKRIRREIQRVGVLRFLDVIAFRFYDRFVWGNKDRAWEADRLARLEVGISRVCPTFRDSSPTAPIRRQPSHLSKRPTVTS